MGAAGVQRSVDIYCFNHIYTLEVKSTITIIIQDFWMIQIPKTLINSRLGEVPYFL